MVDLDVDNITDNLQGQLDEKTGAVHLENARNLRSYNVGRWGIIITILAALGSVGYIFYKLDSFYAELGSERHRAKIEYQTIDPNEAEESEDLPDNL